MPAGRRRRARESAPGLAALIERWSGLTAAGACVLVVAVVGYVLARKLGGRALYLLVYAGIVVVIAAIATSRRKRKIEAVRSQLPTRMRVGQSADVEITVTS